MDGKVAGYKLPINPEQKQGKLAQGFVTPKQDKLPQIHVIPPRRVLPIIFIPGIMGSNLRLKPETQALLQKKNNIAWRPDNLRETFSHRNDSPAQRQLRLNPATTEVDTYDAQDNCTGDPKETADERNENIKITFTYGTYERLNGPMLQDDLPGVSNRRSRDQKARERGWGEVYFDSYNQILAACECRLNGAFSNKTLDVYLKHHVAGVSPSVWQAHSVPPLKEIDENTMRLAVKGCWFPVHAMGYNWLQSNGVSGIKLATRITELIEKYKNDGFHCEKVILVTHSMGGLVARAIIHPEFGNINDKILGVIHGVMPATGAGTTYKRMRCGFEGSGIPVKILGEDGPRVSAVLSNSQGGLELLPSEDYGSNWLQLKQGKILHQSLPEHGDPYNEIYKVRGKWFSLLRTEWINPAHSPKANFDWTCELLDNAKYFHRKISKMYHENSYAHYGADTGQSAWHRVIWNINETANVQHIESLQIVDDDSKGNIKLAETYAAPHKSNVPRDIKAKLLDAADPGDMTVPVHSADAQLASHRFKGIFRQTGYEHQASYSNSTVIAATLYSLFQIISTMSWSES